MGRVIVVGGGVAGLRCARVLSEAGVDTVLLEGDDRVGGRVRTERRDGYLLDRGFQVLPTGYPEARSCLDFEELELHEFRSGALVRRDGQFRALHDPLRHPGRLLETLRAEVGSMGDRIRLGLWAGKLLAGVEGAALRGRDVTSRKLLADRGFTDEIVDAFFRPFFGGVFLEPELATSGRMLAFVLRTFAAGPAALPAAGMEAIPRQLADGLPRDTIRTGCQVTAVATGGNGVRLADGGTVEGDAVVIATDPWTAARLVPEIEAPERRSVVGLYFGTDAAPVEAPLLVLDGHDEGPVNHLSVQSRVCPHYAPPGRELISVNVVRDTPRDDRELEEQVRSHMREWFGEAVDGWRLLQVDRLPSALPAAPPGGVGGEAPDPRVGPRLYACGDHRGNPSLEGSLVSGRRSAEAVLEGL